MHKVKIQPTAEQISTLSLLRRRLAENGYLIADVAVPYRRHVTDFVVIPKDRPRHFAIIRAAKKYIVVRPFAEPRGELCRLLPAITEKAKAPVRLSMPQLHDPKKIICPWREYADPGMHPEFDALDTD